MATDDGLKFPKSGLMLIGMGPGRISSMTIEAKQAAIAADYRRYEAYTALWPSNELKTLENEIGKIELQESKLIGKANSSAAWRVVLKKDAKFLHLQSTTYKQ